MYQVEARLKRNFLAARAAPPPQPLPRPLSCTDVPPLLRQQVLNAAALLLASFLVSDATAAWGGPYSCS
jgi:hypothetical protein